MGLFSSSWLKFAFAVLLMVSVGYSSYNIHLRYWIENPRYIPFYPRVDYDFWAYSAWAYPWKPYHDITPLLRNAGIQREDPIISTNDHTFSVTLYLMNQRGWTNIFHSLSDSLLVEDKISKGAKYLAISDTTDRVVFNSCSHLLEYPILSHQNLHIYDLRPYAVSRNQEKTFQ